MRYELDIYNAYPVADMKFVEGAFSETKADVVTGLMGLGMACHE